MKKALLNSFSAFKRVIVFSIVFSVLAVMLNVITVNAGASLIVIDNTSFKENINSSVWSDPNGDIIVSNSKIIFSEDNFEESRLISTASIAKSNQYDDLFKSEVELTLKSIPEGKAFAVAYSISSVESTFGDSESVAVVFSNNSNRLAAKAVYFDADGKMEELSKSSVAVQYGGKITVKTNVTGESNAVVSINNTVVFSGETPTPMTGRVGFMQNGVCKAEISSVYVESYKYDSPENVTIAEDFETGTFNVNKLISYMSSNNYAAPSGLSVKDYNGSKVLLFKNVGMGWLGTTYKYSNFECTFDIPYVLLSNVIDDNGVIVQPKTDGFIFSYGDQSDFYDTWGYETSADAIFFQPFDVMNFKDFDIKSPLPDIFDPDKNEGYSVKIKVFDTQLTLWVKALNSDNWQELLSYKIGNETPLGYIHIWSVGNTNCAFDNFCVTNLDKDPNIIEVEYDEYHVSGTEDWVYKPMEVIYKKNSSVASVLLSWPMIPVYTLVLAVVSVAVAILIKKKKDKKVAQAPLNVEEGVENKDEE